MKRSRWLLSLFRNREVRWRCDLVCLGEIALIDANAQTSARVDVEERLARRHIAERFFEGEFIFVTVQCDRNLIADLVAQFRECIGRNVQHEISERPIRSDYLSLQTFVIDGCRVDIESYEL